MVIKLVRRRQSAYATQSGRCYYCGFPMWEDDPESFARAHKIKLCQAQPLKCTAEHLKARKDGGNDTMQNIVAACLWCNSRRHRIRQAPGPSAYRELVQQELSKGLWHCKLLRKRFKALASGPNNGVQAKQDEIRSIRYRRNLPSSSDSVNSQSRPYAISRKN